MAKEESSGRAQSAMLLSQIMDGKLMSKSASLSSKLNPNDQSNEYKKNQSILGKDQ